MKTEIIRKEPVEPPVVKVVHTAYWIGSDAGTISDIESIASRVARGGQYYGVAYLSDEPREGHKAYKVTLTVEVVE